MSRMSSSPLLLVSFAKTRSSSPEVFFPGVAGIDWFIDWCCYFQARLLYLGLLCRWVSIPWASTWLSFIRTIPSHIINFFSYSRKKTANDSTALSAKLVDLAGLTFCSADRISTKANLTVYFSLTWHLIIITLSLTIHPKPFDTVQWKWHCPDQVQPPRKRSLASFCSLSFFYPAGGVLDFSLNLWLLPN